jgi:hypothetical protein
MTLKPSPLYPDYIRKNIEAKTCISVEDQQVIKRKKLQDAAINQENDANKALQLTKKDLKSTTPKCMIAVNVGYCSGNHFFYKPVECGREYCEHCGKDGSSTHLRRIDRVKKAVLSWNSLSYLVITIPEACRDQFRSKSMLNEFRTFIRRKLKREGFTEGVFRWHYAGSCLTCKGLKSKRAACYDCEGTGAGRTYEPHLNILLPSGNTRRMTKAGKDKEGVNCYDPGRNTLKKSYIEAFRNSLEDWFLKHCGKKTTGNIYHNFVGARDKNKRARYLHKLRYVMRSTLRFYELFKELTFLKGYRTTSHLGKILEKLPKLEKCCPLCDKPLKWYSEHIEKWFEPGKRERLIPLEGNLFFLRFDTQLN